MVNARAQPLELETLYGSGFDGCAHALHGPADDLIAACLLPLGPVRFETVGAGSCPMRDLARTSDGQPRIADARNDNNALVAQMLTLFAQAHNALVVHLAGKRPAGPHGRNSRPDQSERVRLFVAAQSVLITIYRQIVRDDLLPRLLHPEVHHALTAGAAPAQVGHDGRVPVTFVHALRFGHAMIRPRYRVNDLLNRDEELIDVLLTNGRGRPWRMPVDESWAVQWGRFFDLGGRRPNLARRIGPQFSVDLVAQDVFEPIDATGAMGLAYRDLVATAHGSVPPVAELCRCVLEDHPEWAIPGTMLGDAAYRRRTVHEFLSARADAAGLPPAAIEALATAPPLLLVLLLEAGLERQGTTLGRLGSMLVGAPLLRLLREPHRAVADPPFTAADSILGISDMPGLVQFVRTHGRPDERVLPFV
jgi:hypothetical protein